MKTSVRLPAYPLIPIDPYFSLWSMRDRLTEDWTKHWTGANHTLRGLIRVDGVCHRFMGIVPKELPELAQTGIEVLPTRTRYTFESGSITLQLTFLTPSLLEDLDLSSWPLGYVEAVVDTRDGKEHDVAVYLDATAEFCVDHNSQKINAARRRLEGCEVVFAEAAEPRVLARAGDNLRIEWGTFYLAAPAGATTLLTTADEGCDLFAKGLEHTASDPFIFPTPLDGFWPRLATIQSGRIGQGKTFRCVTTLVYDDYFSIEYHHRKLPPYWRRDGKNAADIIRQGLERYPELFQRCETLDRELMKELEEVGGEKYALLAALSYRQCLAAHKLVEDRDGKLLYMSKENFSNGCIATVDVTYPSAPFFLLFKPELLKAQLTPILDYALSSRWKFDFAPHDLGTYPLANGQVYGGAERSEKDQMPVEECGNMLILVAALAKAQGSVEYASSYWKLLTRWADYLVRKGFNPEEQLCTDDFAGHLAQNTNLSLKAIVALACYAQLCEKRGLVEEHSRYRKLAEEMMARWEKEAADGDHYRLAFDRPGTWSQKYNLVWDELLDLKLVPRAIIDKELAYYLGQQKRYGLPLDSRETYTKLDWIVWVASMTRSKAEFEAFIDPLYLWLQETPSRVPLTDWYSTVDGKQISFQARSVVGGVFIQLLKKKWSS